MWGPPHHKRVDGRAPDGRIAALATHATRADESPSPCERGRTQGGRPARLRVVRDGTERRGDVPPLGEGSGANQEPRPLDIAGVDRQACEGGRNGGRGGTHGGHRGASFLGNDSVSVHGQVGEQ
jgi:hypothetical protein